MSNAIAESTNWYRVIIDDSQLAMSTGFRLLLETITKHVPSSVVRATHLEIFPNAATELLTTHGPTRVFSVESLFDALGSITQLVWGRFFLFADSSDAEKAIEEDLANNIAVSQVTVCVVDNSSCFVFTKSFSLVCELLAGNWRVEVIKHSLSTILARREEF
jgi:hypothetical protein